MGDFANSTQRFDWNPGIEPSGLFWTMPIGNDQFNANVPRGRARWRATRLAVPDYGDFGNSIAPPDVQIPPTPSHVSFDVRWQGGGAPTDIDDDTFDFSGTFLDQAAAPPGVPDGLITIDFAAHHDASTTAYRSDNGPQHVVSGGVGRERNGIFH